MESHEECAGPLVEEGTVGLLLGQVIVEPLLHQQRLDLRDPSQPEDGDEEREKEKKRQ